MSLVRYAARVGAAAFVLGLTLCAPHSIAVAAAGPPDTTSAPDGPGPADVVGAPAVRAARGATTGTRSGAQRAQLVRPAAGGLSPGGVRAKAQADVPVTVAKGDRSSRRSHTPPPTTDVTRTALPGAGGLLSVGSVESQRPATASTAVVSPAAAPAPQAFPARVSGQQDSMPGAATAVANSVPSESASAPAEAAPARVVLDPLSSPTGSATSSFADLLDMLSPIRAFSEGVALLVRRTLFNEAPTVSPVQLTGLSDGPINGALGAVDPEGDRLVYRITGTPRYGTAVVGSDGGYTYTPGPDFAGTDSFRVAVGDAGLHINLGDLSRPAASSASVAVGQGAPLLRFQFTYGSGSRYWSSAARSALESAATQLSSYFVVSSPVTITYAVTGERKPSSTVLASAGSDPVSDGVGFQQTVVQRKILTGTDTNGATADGVITWNFGQPWALGDTVADSQYDFDSTAMHELLHSFGFTSSVSGPGDNNGQNWYVFDSFLVDAGGAAVISGNFTWNSAYDPNLTGGNGGLYFGGPNAVAAYNGPVPLYTPNPWQGGSSVAHLDDTKFTGSNQKIMNADTDKGLGVRVLSPVELGIMQDLGYQVSSGTGTSALMFVVIAFTRHVRRKDLVAS